MVAATATATAMVVEAAIATTIAGNVKEEEGKLVEIFSIWNLFLIESFET